MISHSRHLLAPLLPMLSRFFPVIRRLGCSAIVFTVLLGAPVWGQTVTLSYELTIQPIYVQNGPAGSIAVKTNYESLFLPSNSIFKAATQQIWAQAGVKINWLAPVTLVSSTYYSGITSDSALDTLLLDSGNLKNASSNVMNMWFVGPSGSVLGLSKQTIQNPSNSLASSTFLNGVTVSESVFSGSHYDTIAHEIGHNLGLTHFLADNSTPVPAGTLMTATATGVTLGNIYPFGTQMDGLSSREITLVQSIAALNGIFNPALIHTITPESYTYSLISVPEPADYAVAAGLLAGIVAIRRKRKSHQDN